MRPPGTIDPDLYEWDAWRPEHAARLLAHVQAPWYVAAGWAIDLFLGAQRREHGDLEIAVPADRFDEVVDALAAYELFVVGPALAVPLAQAGELLGKYPDLGARARGRYWAPCGPLSRALRARPVGRPPRRKHPAALRQRDRAHSGWIPFGRPELVLLFKAKHAQSKDDGDLAAVLPLLSLSDGAGSPRRSSSSIRAIAGYHG